MGRRRNHRVRKIPRPTRPDARETVERYFGVQVAGSAKNDMMRAKFSILDFSTLAACDASQVKLESYALSIGYRDVAGFFTLRKG